MAIVDGLPAISYQGQTHNSHSPWSLMYVRATDPRGSSWGVPITVDTQPDGDEGSHSSLAVVGGNPAISYTDRANGALQYVRATDAKGSSWGAPVTVDPNQTGDSEGRPSLYTSLAVIDGNPAISYSDNVNGTPKYVRATDPNGSSWGDPVPVDAGARGEHTSLALVNGRPAIGYYNGTERAVRFIRATDADGSSWGAPKDVDSVNGLTSGSGLTLKVVNGNPAVSYNDKGCCVVYVRATDANGSSWGSPEGSLPRGSQH